MADEALRTGSIVNVHLHDGSATGGYEYVGLNAFARADKREPELILRPVDDGQEPLFISVGSVAWVDVLAVPFEHHGLRDED